MTDLIFNDPEEAAAWDRYVAGALACPHLIAEGALEIADTLILERRKRMAPEKVEREWTPHKPGDPMPCDGDDWVSVKFWDGSFCIFQKTAKTHNWSEDAFPKIIAWRPA